MAWARKGWKRVFAAICNGIEGFVRSRMPGFKEKTVGNEEKTRDGNWPPIFMDFRWMLKPFWSHFRIENDTINREKMT